MKKIYYVANARMPNEKAHGIQIAKMCEAFIEAGADLTLVVPHRGMSQSLRDFYHLRVDVPLVRLSAINLYNYERIGYFISSLSFMCTSLLFLWWKRLCGGKFVIYTIDLDNYSSSVLPLAGMPLFTELHGGKPRTLAQRFLFKHLRGVFAINTLIVEECRQKFPRSRALYLAEPNGVDADLFAERDKREARAKLGVGESERVAVYTGRFFEWKGLEILPQAAERDSGIVWYIVGGTREEFCEVSGIRNLPQNMHFMGSREQSEIPWWLAAADALIVLGTKRDEQSYSYTSPMKLFEYLLSGRAIVASDTPAIRQIVSEKEAFLYEPDAPESLVHKIQEAMGSLESSRERIILAHKKGELHSWKNRAKRILSGIEHA